jgi:hypothetical protein
MHGRSRPEELNGRVTDGADDELAVHQAITAAGYQAWSQARPATVGQDDMIEAKQVDGIPRSQTDALAARGQPLLQPGSSRARECYGLTEPPG